MSPRARSRLARAVAGVAILVVLVLFAHEAIGWACRIEPPEVALSRPALVAPRVGVRRVGPSVALRRGALWEVHLRGTPEAIGYAHARLLYPEMVANEGVLLDHFRAAVPTGVLRALLLDLAQLRYRDVAKDLDPARRVEIAAGALAFAPDPYAELFPTFQRFVYLNTLYDIALSFEHSPLIGCTTFAFSGAESAAGGTLLARNFDFEVDPIFDREKAVFFVRETGKIGFASVAWPGLVGVVSGMNAEGVAVVVHGGRAGTPRARGEPVVHALRAVLSNARTTREAVAELARRPPLVSHLVVLADRAGHAVRVERVPGAADHVIELGAAAAVTNHFDGPAAGDAKNDAVRRTTSTLPRKARADELVRGAPRPVTAATAVALLRDRKGAGDKQLALGDRNAIDALIATHGVVMNTAEGSLWVSEAPHLLGRFVAFDVPRVLGEAEPSLERDPPTLPADPLRERIAR